MRETEPDYAELMQEPPGGFNYGSRDGTALLAEAAQAADVRRDRGFSVVNPSKGTSNNESLGAADAGMSAHRGVVQYGQHIDAGRVRQLVTQALGFTAEQFATAYAPGRPTSERLALRERIDARLLDLQRKGGNMLALARVLGWPIREDKGECRRMAAALARARRAET